MCSLAGTGEHDAPELYTHVLNTVHDNLVTMEDKKLLPRQETIGFMEKSMITDIFGGIVESFIVRTFHHIRTNHA